MSPEPANEASIFNTARKIASSEDRDVYLRKACGTDAALRERVEKLLSAYTAESQFLERPAEALGATIVPDGLGNDLTKSLQAGLAASFSEGEAVVIGNANHSVLKTLGQTVDVQRVVLRDVPAQGDDPIQRPNSPEMPDRDGGSRYQLQGEIARGGMGAIIKGRDTDLGRDLAIKVLLDVHKDKPEVIQRFVEEAQIGGQLQHPGIAPVYELGQFADRRPFFSMKLVKGQTLSALLAKRDGPTADRAKLLGIFEQICQTMAYAHSRGVIHRDLKPANVMVGAFGEVQVMDWGLAKVLSEGGVADEKNARDNQPGQSVIETRRSTGSDTPGSFGSAGSGTQMGSVLGTPAYMPPEQALGEIDQLDRRADVFGLGAILCELLTGQPPYVGQDGTQVFRMASRGKLDEALERLDDCGADADLVALAKDALEIEPDGRPRDAGALAERVTGYLESVETKLRETEMKRAAEAARVVEERKRRKVTLALAASVLLMLGLGGGGWVYLERQQADRRVAAAARVNEALGDVRLQAGLALGVEVTTEGGLKEQAGKLEQALRSATTAVKLAEQEKVKASLLSSAEELEAELAKMSSDATRLADKAVANRELREELDLIRLSLAGGGDGELEHLDVSHIDRYGSTHGAWLDKDTAGERYEEAFREAGYDLITVGTDEVTAWIKHSAIHESLIAALDNWARITPRQTLVERMLKPRTGRQWTVAARIGREQIEKQPNDSQAWYVTAPMVVLADDGSGYPDFCQRLAQQFGETKDAVAAARACRIGLLTPEVIDPNRLPHKTLAQALDGNTPSAINPSFWGIRALVAYRRGQAVSALKYLQKSNELNSDGNLNVATVNLAVRALVRWQLDQQEKARQDVTQCAQAIRRMRMVDPSQEHSMLMIAEILYREAVAETNAAADDELLDELKEADAMDGEEAFDLRAQLLLVADAADNSKWRTRLRAALSSGAFDMLKQLATEEQVRDQSPAMIVWLGEALREAKALEASVTVLREAQQRQPDDFWLNHELSRSLRGQGDVAESMSYARAAVAIRPRSSGAHYDLGLALKAQGNLDAAIAQYRNAIQLDRKYVMAYRELGFALTELDQLEEAIVEFRSAVALEPHDPGHSIFLANCLIENKQTDEGLGIYDKLAEKHPQHVGVHANRGWALGKAAEWEKSIEASRRAIQLDPNCSVTVYMDLALALLGQGNLDAGVDAYREAIKLDPKCAPAYYNLALALKEQGNLDEAIAAFREGLKLYPTYAPAYINLGIALKEQGNLDEAIAAFRKAIKLAPKWAEGHANLGIALQAQEKLDQAIAAYRKAIELDPKTPGIYRHLGIVLDKHLSELAQEGQLDKAADVGSELLKTIRDRDDRQSVIDCVRPDVLEKLADRLPEDGQVQVSLVRKLADRGDHEKATVARDKARTLLEGQLAAEPDSADVAASLAELLHLTGDKVRLAELLQHHPSAAAAVGISARTPVDNVEPAPTDPGKSSPPEKSSSDSPPLSKEDGK